MLDFSLFRDPAFLSGSLAAALSLFALAGMGLLTTQRFQLIGGFTPFQAGLLLSATACGSLPSALLGGAILHRVGLRVLIAGGLGLGAAGVLTLSFGIDHGLGWAIAGLSLTGFGLGASISVASTAIIGNAPAHRAGMASSVEEISYEFGSLFAVALLGSLAAALYSFLVKLPAGTPDAAREGFIQAMMIARESGLSDLASAAKAAYEQSYTAMLSVIVGTLITGSIVTGALLRNYGPGSATSQTSGHPCYET